MLACVDLPALSKAAKARRLAARTVSDPASAGPAETGAPHARILGLGLGIEESRSYWECSDPSLSILDRHRLAFEHRWFGSKSSARVQYLLRSLAARYEAFPKALFVLRRWSPMDYATRLVLCHWHLQLSDPVYRRFTSEFLAERRRLIEPLLTRRAALCWLVETYPHAWCESTCVHVTNKLLLAAFEAGLVSKGRMRHVLLPRVNDRALGYLLYLLRETQFSGTLTRNAYLESVGLDEAALVARATRLPGIVLRRIRDLWEFDWQYPDLATWASEVVS